MPVIENCDRCGVRSTTTFGKVRGTGADMTTAVLAFCSHHTSAFAPELMAEGFEIIDDRRPATLVTARTG